jgi:hypothetical protein
VKVKEEVKEVKEDVSVADSRVRLTTLLGLCRRCACR